MVLVDIATVIEKERYTRADVVVFLFSIWIGRDSAHHLSFFFSSKAVKECLHELVRRLNSRGICLFVSCCPPKHAGWLLRAAAAACLNGVETLEKLHTALKFAKASACPGVALEQRLFEWTNETVKLLKDAPVVPRRQGTKRSFEDATQ